MVALNNIGDIGSPRILCPQSLPFPEWMGTEPREAAGLLETCYPPGEPGRAGGQSIAASWFFDSVVLSSSTNQV